MPIYEYVCEKCNHEFEREQRITDEPVKTCPSCRSRKVKKLISRTSFVLKGGGWYADAYSSAKPGGGDDKAPKTGSDSKSSSSDSKSESKSDTKASDKSDSKKSNKPSAKQNAA